MGCSIQKQQLPQQVSVQVHAHPFDSEFDRTIPETSRRPGVSVQILLKIKPMIYERNCMFPVDCEDYPLDSNPQIVNQEQPTHNSDQFKSLDLMFKLIRPQQVHTSLGPQISLVRNGRQNTSKSVFDCPSPKFISLEEHKHLRHRQHKKKKNNEPQKYNLDELF